MDRLEAAERKLNEAKHRLASVQAGYLHMRQAVRQARAMGEDTLEREIELLEQARIVRKFQARLRDAEANYQAVLTERLGATK